MRNSIIKLIEGIIIDKMIIVSKEIETTYNLYDVSRKTKRLLNDIHVLEIIRDILKKEGIK